MTEEKLKTLQELKVVYIKEFKRGEVKENEIPENNEIYAVSRYGDLITDNELIEKNKLRQEAIKWIKDMQRAEEEVGSYDHLKEPFTEFSASYDGEVKNVINWIKHFFNISEEDLK